MGLLARNEIEQALRRLGELASEQGLQIPLLIVGGAYMVLALNARPSTKDVDAVVLDPAMASQARTLAGKVSTELDLPVDWLNDAAKGYLVGTSTGSLIFSHGGLRAFGPSLAQMLAMKLSAWRDDVDIDDASRVLAELERDHDKSAIWDLVRPFLVAGAELKAQYALADLMEQPDGPA